ncbi:MAG: STAS domain-containing protein [Chloroflexi bacterium]|nr:STAS domain-containing protein [Chloroflexota bacterium]
MTDPITTAVERRDALAIIYLSGDMTASAEQAIQDAYDQAVTSAPHVLILSFDATDYINSAGVAILIGLVTQARRAGLPVRIAGLSDHFVKILGMVGLAQYVTLCPTLQDELAL